MGLLNWLETKYTGVDLAAEQARGDAADAQTAKLNEAALASGHYTQAQYDQAQADLASGATGDVQAQVNDAAKQGAMEGLKSLQDGIQSATSFSLKGIFGLIPWQLWIVAGVVVFWYLGGFVLLKGSLSRRVSQT